MKYLLRILFVLALFCGVTSHARAAGFHVGVVDPNTCGSATTNPPTSPSTCTIIDASGPITGFEFSSTACNAQVPMPAGTTPFCIDLFNTTVQDIASISLSISASELNGDMPICDNTGSSVEGSCTMSGGIDTFTFNFLGGGGQGVFGTGDIEDIYVYSLDDPNPFDPTVLDGATLTITETPEPDSLLLFGTGVMMAGLYMSKRPLLSAFGKK